MNIDDLVFGLLERPDDFAQNLQLLKSWPPYELENYVERRKAAADSYWNSDPTVSLAIANEIIGIGCLLDNRAYLALGLMARGDAIKLIGRSEEAWDTLELAGEVYLSISGEVGWGRTRIGRLSVCINVGRVDEALADAEIARSIFERHGEVVRMLRLDMNVAYFHTQIGDYQQALAGYNRALETALSWKEQGEEYLGLLYTNVGYSYAELGDLRRAEQYHLWAHTFFIDRGNTLHLVKAEFNLAYIAILQGRYRDALKWLYGTGTLADSESLVEHITARQLLIQCYLFLNRYKEARTQALDLLKQCRVMKMMTETGFILLYLAMAEAELGHEAAALAALEESEAIFQHTDSQSWAANVRLRRAQLALRRGDADQAKSEASGLIEYFQTANEQVNLALALLLQGQAAAVKQDWAAASMTGQNALKIAWKSHTPWLRYSSQLLLGQIAEAQGQTDAAIRRYRAAAGTVERLQRDLSITLRPGFLGDKEEALHRLIGLHLHNEQFTAAWGALERAKSQVLLNYLLNRDNLRWSRDDVRAEPLIQQLERLRQDYAAYDQLAHEMPPNGETAMRGMAHHEIQDTLLKCEGQIRDLTEQLYLITGSRPMDTAQMPSVADVQGRLGDEQVLVEFYNHDQQLWAFIIDRYTIQAKPLKATTHELRRALRDFEFDRDVALAICTDQGPYSRDAQDHIAVIRDDLKQLYHLLVEPIAPVLEGKERTILVPYGVLHYLPFHLLHDGCHHWIEKSEIVVLPTAGLMLAENPHRQAGALILADDWNGWLPQTLHEGLMVSGLLQGELHHNEKAVRGVLTATPRQVLHIAAHGRYRMDQPDMSYIHLHDGQLLSDDLFQNDLSYELVTLSACETGRAEADSGDELIGLGRGFLYAGAGALIASLWRIEDQLTLQLMDKLYTGLNQDHLSKAAALRRAQLELFYESPNLHPLFWGAFQLIGNAEPLSIGE
jgi:tetratricopeptide (TPR) repeat protein